MITQELKANINEQYRRYIKQKQTNAFGDEDIQSCLQNLVHLYVYSYPATVSRWYEELSGDFWNQMSGKVSSYIENFMLKAVPFEHYLSVAVKYQFISFLKNTIQREKELRMYQSPHAFFAISPSYDERGQSVEFELEYLIDFLQRHAKNSGIARRRLWWFVLYCSPMLPLERVREMGVLLGYSLQNVSMVLLDLQKEIMVQSQRLEQMKRRCNMYFAKKHLLERKLTEDALSKDEILRCMEMREVYNKRYSNALAKLQDITCTISHARLAQLLQVPKGTIDSGISLLRKQCMSLRKKLCLNEKLEDNLDVYNQPLRAQPKL